MVKQVKEVQRLTLEEFTEKYAGKRYEYVDGRAVPMGPEIVGPDGEITVTPTKSIHGLFTLELGRLIGNYVREKNLGMVFGAETGFMMTTDPPEMRAADVAFISRERLKEIDLGDWLPIPDLAVEVISESERAAEVRRKTRNYMANGTRLLWIVYPEDREIVAHRPDRPVQALGVDDTLEGGDVLPGFAVQVEEIFAVLDRLS